MRIDLHNVIARQLAEANAKRTGNAPSSPLPAEDKASFSHAPVSVHSLVEEALSPSTVRQERVTALRHAVRNGTYSVDAEAAADAMIRESSGS